MAGRNPESATSGPVGVYDGNAAFVAGTGEAGAGFRAWTRGAVGGAGVEDGGAVMVGNDDVVVGAAVASVVGELGALLEPPPHAVSPSATTMPMATTDRSRATIATSHPPDQSGCSTMGDRRASPLGG